MRIIIINGPNLNLLGTREPDLYGQETMDHCLASLRKRFPQVEIEYYQSNHEGALVDRLQETGFTHDGIILNAAAIPIPALPCSTRSAPSAPLSWRCT